VRPAHLPAFNAFLAALTLRGHMRLFYHLLFLDQNAWNANIMKRREYSSSQLFMPETEPESSENSPKRPVKELDFRDPS
jgi:hypothetical protein